MANGSTPSDSSESPTDDDDDGNGEDIRNIYIEMPVPQFERVNEQKKRHGFTWKGLVLYACRQLERDHACTDDA